MTDIPEPLKSILNDYCHVEWAEEMNELPSDIGKNDWAYDALLFKEQLRGSIMDLRFSLKDYENVTGEDFERKDELVDRLKGIWAITFPNEEP